MIKQILVPLDGSELAEIALPVARYFAGVLGASVTLLHVIERDARPEIHHKRHLTKPEEAFQYLQQTAKQAFPATIPVETHVHKVEVKDVAQSIADHSEELGPDLIIMCSHGKGGARDALFGNIAQQVLSIGTLPVILIPPRCCLDDFTCKKLLAPLDGQPEHEASLPLAIELAERTKASLYLVTVIPTLSRLSGEQAAVSQMLPSAMTALLDIQEEQGHIYLEQLANEARKEKIAVHVKVLRGDPAQKIVNYADSLPADLLVVATHAKTGADAFWSGSASPKITGRSLIPLLFIPIKG